MNWKTIALACSVALLATACKSTSGTDNQGATGSGDGSGYGQYAPDALTNPNSPLSKRSVYFDFDSSAIRNEFRPLVQDHSNFLKAMPNRSVQIQGNTDARGSREYNLGLGQRRAESVRQSMQLLGVKDSQMEAISFGKERPRALGNTEADYAQNRRADLVYDGESGRRQ